MLQRKKWVAVPAAVLLVLALLLAACYANHRFCLEREEALLEPPGRLVEVDRNRMSVYTEGEGAHTLVFLSGGGTCSPILDFKSLYSLLSGEVKIAVVEKFGYGFSDVVDEVPDIGTILRQTRAALTAAGVEGPYVLCPHSMSGLEALYWAQQYPEEVEGIVGLDMAVPEYYEHMELSLPVIKLGQWAAQMGISRLIPGLAESDAIQYGTLTGEEKEVYRALFYRRTATATMIREVESVAENARIVAAGEVPQVPMLLFLSDGSGGTGFDTPTWREIPKSYLNMAENGRYIELDCPHYIHDHEYEQIAEEIGIFLDLLEG